MDFNSVIYTDEVEIMVNPEKDQGLTIHFNGIYFDIDKAPFIKYDLEPIVREFGKKGFHSKKLFKEKTDSYYNLMVLMTDLIIKHKIIWINFPFPKSNMKNKGLKPFFDLKFENGEYQKSNYRAVAFYLYFHSIHYYQEKHKIFKPQIRIYADKDEYLKIGTEYFHSGKLLTNIERILSTRGTAEPFLYFADLVGFMFGRVKNHIGNDIVNIKPEYIETLDPLTRICFFNVQRIVMNGLFKYFNFWEIMPTE